ncbi:MAG: hypothetical protein ACC645_24400, partial [Pirellulales bacterium]
MNNDGIDDIAVAVTMVDPAAAQQWGNPSAHGVYLLFGRETWTGTGTIDVVREADVVITRFSGKLSVAGVGDFNGDPDSIDDLLIGDVDLITGVGNAYLFYGRDQWQEILLRADFSDLAGDNAFIVENDPRGFGYTDGLWHRTTRRETEPSHSSDTSYYFGNELLGTYDVGKTAGRLVTPPIELAGVDPAIGAEFSFSYFLETEPASGDDRNYDIATVMVARDGGFGFGEFEPLPEMSYLPPFVDNAAVLIDPTSGWNLQKVDLSLVEADLFRFAADLTPFEIVSVQNDLDGNIISPLLEAEFAAAGIFLVRPPEPGYATTVVEVYGRRWLVMDQGITYAVKKEPSGLNVYLDAQPLLDVSLGVNDVKFAFDFDTIDAFANNFEGWYVDDVTVRQPVYVPEHADVVFQGTGLAGFGDSVSGSGPVSGNADLAILASQSSTVFIFDAAPLSGNVTPGQANRVLLDAAFSLNPGEDLTGFALRPAGDVNGTGRNDLLVSSPGKSFLVTDDLAIPNGFEVTPAANLDLFSLGDIDGDNNSDLGASVLELSPTLDEDGSRLAHQVGQAFLGGPAGPDFDVPDMAFEAGRPAYVSEASATIRPLLFGPAGDVNGDGIGDLAVGDHFGNNLSVLLGQPLVVPPVTGIASAAREEFLFELATPVVVAARTGPSGVNLSASPNKTALDNAFVLEGVDANEMLAQAQNIGDFND